MSDFGVRVRARRDELKLSQSELGAMIGLSQAGVSRLEASEESPSDFRLLTKLAKALKEPLSEYLSEDPSSGMEMFFAFCPNPKCRSNSHRFKNGSVTLIWSSWESYPAQQFVDINFCPECGTGLVKECSECKRRFSKAESKYCIRCGEEICKRPTDEEWEWLKGLYVDPNDVGPIDPSPPGGGEENIPF